MNWWLLFVTPLIPMVIGAIWYHPKVFGPLWMRASGVTEEQTKTGNIFLIFGLSYLFGVFLSQTMSTVAIHQMGVAQTMMTDPEWGVDGSAVMAAYNQFMADYGNSHRTWAHGFLHGGFAALTFALPILGIIALFERRGWRYFLVHTGYWFVTLLLMGGVICALL
ncbi:MAG: DUF1761 domain-containing protein [Bacteroidota bacterium]